MKTLKIIVLLVVAIIISCNEKKAETVKKSNSTTSVKHYICKNKCENSGGPVAGNCPVCKDPYIHNQAFHDKDFLKSGPLNVPESTGAQNTKTNNTQPSPARNAAGVFHYTCTNGCYGGAGSAVTCKVCGETLVHNTAYHNN